MSLTAGYGHLAAQFVPFLFRQGRGLNWLSPSVAVQLARHCRLVNWLWPRAAGRLTLSWRVRQTTIIFITRLGSGRRSLVRGALIDGQGTLKTTPTRAKSKPARRPANQALPTPLPAIVAALFNNAPARPRAITDCLDDYWDFAIETCARIEAQDADLVIGLAHGGGIVLDAAKHLWARTRRQPFPASLLTNIGIEKRHHYLTHRQTPPFCCLGGGPLLAGDRGHLAGWLERNSVWQAELAHPVQAVIFGSPRRVVVVDDFRCEGWSLFITDGLLESLYPEVQATSCTMPLDSRHSLAELCVREYLPDCLEALNQLEPAAGPNLLPRAYIDRLRHNIMTGTEDVAPESLTWRPLTADNPDVQALTHIRPAEVWLAFAGQVREYLARNFDRRLALDPAAGRRVVEPRRSYPLLDVMSRALYLAIWKGRVDAKTLGAASQVPLAEAAAVLRRLRMWLHLEAHSRGRSVWYTPMTWAGREAWVAKRRQQRSR